MSVNSTQGCALDLRPRPQRHTAVCGQVLRQGDFQNTAVAAYTPPQFVLFEQIRAVKFCDGDSLMRILVIGCGLVGTALADRLRGAGHVVVGTTTRAEKVEALLAHCDQVEVLRGSERDKVHRAAADCDAIVVCAGPAAQQAMTPEQRATRVPKFASDANIHIVVAGADAGKFSGAFHGWATGPMGSISVSRKIEEL